MLLASSVCSAQNSYRSYVEQAKAEYTEPVRPGDKTHPFWNEFSKKFMYAPAFNFGDVKGAVTYEYCITWEADNRLLHFRGDSPRCSLGQVWNEIPAGKHCRLIVNALDAKGEFLAKAGEREFFRDFPFNGPYTVLNRTYTESAIMGLLYIHNMKAIQSWKNSTEPDMRYDHNTYACKIIGATVRSEILLARMCPEYKDDALKIARNAAQFLIDQSRPEGEPLAYFPPTYYKNLVASKRQENQGKTMTMEAAAAGEAYLDLYDYTKEEKYFALAVNIANTYRALQRLDGSFPIKVDFYTGEPVNKASAMLHPIIRYIERLRTYGVNTFDTMLQKSYEWMDHHVMTSFDMTGQFEDVTVQGLHPYENLTNCTAAPYASMLLRKANATNQDLANARDLIRFSEDQFVYWDCAVKIDGIKRDTTPCVFEQYKYAMPVDASASNVSNAWMDYYEVTGDVLSLLKAEAMLNTIINVQNPVTGQIPTTWRLRYKTPSFWINCSYNAINSMLRLEKIKKSGQKFVE